ncbi:Vacuolar iron transporter 1 [Escovopsis weberi]|uniref:Vacuolar iron transporter 1 n=1 Tax=Escovopsis weberi TaxID=150374 RepID=A0A0M8MXX5_ESCWE|nr:Vacuolar iron transporter 1 [Escovopsis weberi]
MPSETSPLLPAEPPTEQPWYDSKAIISSSDDDASSLSSSFSSSSSSSSLDTTAILRDVIIGFSDGLTVPFALTAGLSSLGSAKLVIMGGLAELFSGMISMGLGAYLAAATEREHYASAHAAQLRRARLAPAAALRDDVCALLADRYAVSRGAAAPLADELARPGAGGGPRDAWVRFTLDLAAGLERPGDHRAWISGLTMGLSYFLGGLIPMIPYFVMAHVMDALVVSVAVTVLVLLVFGYVKNFVAIRNHRAGVWGAIQTLIIGVLAAGTSYIIVKLLDGVN